MIASVSKVDEAADKAKSVAGTAAASAGKDLLCAQLLDCHMQLQNL